jgi:hypothetical protein
VGKASRRKRGRTIAMAVIPEPEPGTRSVLHYTGEGTVMMRGEGQTTLVCGKCAAPLAVGVQVTALQSLVITCKNCGSYNETLA